MRKFAAALVAGLVIGWSSFASADTNYTAQLTLVGDRLPDLRVGSSALDGPHNIDGDWAGFGIPTARAFTRDQTGVDASNDATWSDWYGSADLHRYGGDPRRMGEAIGRSPQLDRNASAEASVYLTSIHAKGFENGLGAEVEASAGWIREFSLNAGASFTFAMLCVLDVIGDAAPLDIESSFTVDPNSSFASLSMLDMLGRVGAQLTATINGITGDALMDILSFDFGPGGLMSLTLNNTTGGVISGSLGAGAYVSVSAPIPEPGMWLMLAFGLAVIALGRRAHR